MTLSQLSRPQRLIVSCQLDLATINALNRWMKTHKSVSVSAAVRHLVQTQLSSTSTEKRLGALQANVVRAQTLQLVRKTVNVVLDALERTVNE